MLPGASDHSDLYSTQLSKRTPCMVQVDFKRIWKLRRAENGIFYASNKWEKNSLSLYMYASACLLSAALRLDEQQRQDLKALLCFFLLPLFCCCLLSWHSFCFWWTDSMITHTQINAKLFSNVRFDKKNSILKLHQIKKLLFLTLKMNIKFCVRFFIRHFIKVLMREDT